MIVDSLRHEDKDQTIFCSESRCLTVCPKSLKTDSLVSFDMLAGNQLDIWVPLGKGTTRRSHVGDELKSYKEVSLGTRSSD